MVADLRIKYNTVPGLRVISESETVPEMFRTVIGARMSYRKWRENKQHLT